MTTTAYIIKIDTERKGLSYAKFFGPSLATLQIPLKAKMSLLFQLNKLLFAMNALFLDIILYLLAT